MANYKVPRAVEILGELPLNMTGKVIKGRAARACAPEQVGIAMFHRLSIPSGQKVQITVRSSSNDGSQLNAVHTSPSSVIAPDDAIKFFGIYRVADALESCALLGENCDADLGFMGTGGDGTPVLPSVVTDNP